MNYKRISSKTLLVLTSLILFVSCIHDKKLQAPLNIDFRNASQYQFVEVDNNLEMSYLDIGNIKNPTVLLIHGEPNSSFVYRNIAPKLVSQNFRVIIPDLIGFGYSDKPVDSDVITYSNHTKWLKTFINKLKLSDIYLFAHDWGGMIALRIVAEKPEKFSKVAVSYCYLFDGTEEIPESFKGFINYAENDPNFSAGNIMDWGTNKVLSDSVKAWYDSPFQKLSDYYAVRKFPSLIPLHKDESEGIINKKLNNKLKLFSKPFITIWGNNDDLMWKNKDSMLQELVLGAKNQTHYILDSNHFIQEDKHVELSQILVDFFN